MTALPPEISADDEIAVTWVRDDLSTKVTITLGEATITVETSEEAAPSVPWMVAALPSILDAAWTAIDNDNQEAS